jgi:hypothetical protein
MSQNDGFLMGTCDATFIHELVAHSHFRHFFLLLGCMTMAPTYRPAQAGIAA